MAPIHPEHIDPADRSERELARTARGESDLVQPRARVAILRDVCRVLRAELAAQAPVVDAARELVAAPASDTIPGLFECDLVAVGRLEFDRLRVALEEG